MRSRLNTLAGLALRAAAPAEPTVHDPTAAANAVITDGGHGPSAGAVPHFTVHTVARAEKPEWLAPTIWLLALIAAAPLAE